MNIAQRHRLKHLVMYCATVFGPVHISKILDLRARYEVVQCQGNSKNVHILTVVYK